MFCSTTSGLDPAGTPAFDPSANRHKHSRILSDELARQGNRHGGIVCQRLDNRQGIHEGLPGCRRSRCTHIPHPSLTKRTQPTANAAGSGRREITFGEKTGIPANATAISGDTTVGVASQPRSAEVVDGFMYYVCSGSGSGSTLEGVGSWDARRSDDWRRRRESGLYWKSLLAYKTTDIGQI